MLNKKFQTAFLFYKCFSILSSVHGSSLFAHLGNRILNIQNGNKLLLLPMSILYKMFMLLWKLLIFNFAIMPELLH